MRHLHQLIFASAFLMMVSCATKEVKDLKQKLSSDYEIEAFSSPQSEIAVKQYIEAEKGLNRYYVTQLENLIDGSFTKQVDQFEKKELGFFKSYKYMFQTIFLSRQKNEDIWRVKTSQYFSTIETQQNALECYNNYIKMLGEYRKRFISENNLGHAASAPVLNIPDQSISLNALQDHSRNNLVIEFGVDIAVWLLIFLIITILGLFGIKWTRGYSVVAFVLSLLGSIVLSIINDNHMINSIKVQEKKVISINYKVIIDKLNDNTISFYDAYKK